CEDKSGDESKLNVNVIHLDNGKSASGPTFSSKRDECTSPGGDGGCGNET
ncbi:hypothetical protein A2U01_0027374, partial [Trifolium medium]|nr:hypothetical protein [Trifolium medium]